MSPRQTAAEIAPTSVPRILGSDREAKLSGDALYDAAAAQISRTLGHGRVGNAEARIFCRRLEAELVAVNGAYRTADHWGADLHGRAAQIRCEGTGLTLSALD